MNSYNQRLTYMTPLTRKLKVRQKKNLDYDFRVLGELNYAFISLLAIKLVEWGVKSFSQTTDIMHVLILPTSFVYEPINTKTESKAETRI